MKAYVSLLIVFFLTACIRAAPHLVGQRRPAIAPRDVQVFYQEGPAHYKTIALLDTSGMGVNSSPGQDNRIVHVLRGQAAALGANGLLLIPKTKTVTIGIATIRPTYTAKAIFVPADVHTKFIQPFAPSPQ